MRAHADRPEAVPMLGLLCFLDACISPVMPEILLLPMTLARKHSVAYLTVLCAATSVVGGIFGYLIGALLWDSGLDQLFYDYVPGFTAAGFVEVSARFGDAAFLVVFLAGFTPLPFKLFTIAAGVCHTDVPFVTFLLASVSSRSLKFWLEIWVLRRWGPPLLDLLFKRLGLVLALLIAGALAWWFLR